MLGENLGSDKFIGVRYDTVGPVGWDLLLVVEGVGAIAVVYSTEEGRDGGVVGCVVVGTRWHQLIQQRGGTEEQERGLK